MINFILSPCKTMNKTKILGFLHSSDKLGHITADFLNTIKGYYTIEHDGELIGFIAFKDYDECIRSWKEKFSIKNGLYVCQIIVAEHHRMHGYADILMKMAEDYAKSNGYINTVLCIAHDNIPAKKGSEKRGYIKLGDFSYGDGPIVNIFTKSTNMFTIESSKEDST